MKTQPRARGPVITVDKKNCKIHPAGKVHARGKKHKGYVVFNVVSRCSLLFTNPRVFGHEFLVLIPGHHKYSTRIDEGHTLVMLAGCEYKIPRSLGAASNPTDIIVP